MPSVEVRNWKGSITYHANSVEVIRSVEQLQQIVRDPDRYPSPVRAKGSHHSTTRCVVAEGGTVVDMTRLRRIIAIDKTARTVTVEAGVILIDAAKALEAEGMQFLVNLELGNLTMGSGGTGGTKDASMVSDGALEFGQFSSYCVAQKIVTPDGGIKVVSEDDDPEMMAALRTGYGMLGIAVELTFRIKPIRALAVEHELFDVKDFARDLDAILDDGRSVMLYLFPFLDRVLVEFRSDSDAPIEPGGWEWRVRNWTWKTGWPFLANLLGYLPGHRLRHWITNALNVLTGWFMRRCLRDTDASPADQIIRYSETAGFASYTFSIWAFPRDRYAETIQEYFRFCREYYRLNHYRCDMLNVGYSIAQDRSSMFSYTRDWPALTLDPVASGHPGWEGFLVAYNEWCVRHDGRPLLNQTGSLTPLQAMKSFGPEIAAFTRIRDRVDPAGRFYTDHFRELFSEVTDRDAARQT